MCVFVSDSSDKASIDFTTSLSKDYITNPSSHLRRIRGEIHSDDYFDTGGLEEEECSVETTKNQRFVFIRNKIDLLSSAKSSRNDHSSVEASHLFDYFNKSNRSAMVSHFDVSCSKNTGISDFEEGIGKIVKSILDSNTNGDEDRDSGGGSSSISKGDGVIITRVRHRQHLTLCSVHLESFLQTDRLLDLRAEDLRLAMLELGRITGKVDVDELLDVIFRDFCIGK